MCLKGALCPLFFVYFQSGALLLVTIFCSAYNKHMFSVYGVFVLCLAFRLA